MIYWKENIVPAEERGVAELWLETGHTYQNHWLKYGILLSPNSTDLSELRPEHSNYHFQLVLTLQHKI